MEGKTTLGPHGIPGEDVRAWVPCLELLWGYRVRAHIHETLALCQVWRSKLGCTVKAVHVRPEEHGLKGTRVDSNPALIITSSVILGKSLNLSGPQLLH